MNNSMNKVVANMKQPVLLTFSGNIGAGKTTFAEIAEKTLFTNINGKELGFKSEKEELPKNLADYYQEKRIFEEKEKQGFKIPRLLIYKTQMDFLERKRDQLLKISELLSKGQSCIQDRSIYEDGEIFARNWYERGAISAKVWGDYTLSYRLLVSKLTKPNLIVYLKASPKTCMKRIKERKRPGEEEIDIRYLEKLHLRYEQMFKNFNYCPTLIIDNDNNIEENHAVDVLKRIAKKLEELYG